MLNGITAKLEQYMDLLAERQKVVASNLANIDTPGYRTRDIDFRREFLSQIRLGGPEVVEVGGLPEKNDGNNVSVDREARLLAENALRFNIASNLIRSQIRILKKAIADGGS